MKQIFIKEATKKDLTKLNAISLASKSHWNYPASWMESWKEELRLTTNDFEIQSIFMICEIDEILGFCAIEEKLFEYEINHFWIKPKAMGNGYGKKLLVYILENVVEKKKPILVVSDPNAKAFYRKFGFIIIDHYESKPKGRFLPIMRFSR